MANQLAHNAEFTLSQYSFDSRTDFFRCSAIPMDGLNARIQAALGRSQQVLHRPSRNLIHHHGKGAIHLHAVVGNHQVKANHIARLKHALAWHAVHNCIVGANTNHAWEIWHWLAVGSLGAVVTNPLSHEIINLALGLASCDVITNIAENMRQNTAAIAHSLQLLWRFKPRN